MTRRRDFSLRFRDLGDSGDLLCRGIRAIVVDDDLEIVFAPDTDPPHWPPGRHLHPTDHQDATAAVLRAAQHVVVVDDRRENTRDSSEHPTTAYFVTRGRFRSFANDTTAALARDGRGPRAWTEWAQLGVVRFIRHELALFVELDAGLGLEDPELVCPRCSGHYITATTDTRACRTCLLFERAGGIDRDRWYARWQVAVDPGLTGDE